MTVPQEALVSSSQDAFGFSEESKPMSDVSALVKLLKTNACARNKMGMEMPMCLSVKDENMSDKKQNFPWLSRFSQLCREAVGSQSIKLLENLISVYLRNVTIDVKQCYKKPKRAAKLKFKMNDALKLFHMLYSDIKKPLEYTFYLDRMSDLVAMYMDMEIKASRRSKEQPKKISQRLTSSLFVFLDNSPDHILDSILKAKFFTIRFKEICTPILIRVLRDNPGRIMYEMTYIRYLLTFKLWKKLVDKKETRIEITKLAVSKLIPPFDFLDKLRSGQFSGVLPYVAKSEKDRLTYFLMQSPFNVKEKAEAFLKACRDPKEGMLVVHPAADLGKSLFFSEDIKFSSEPDPKVDGTSMTLMNSIWSSMANTDDSGPGDCFRLCNELSLEPKKSKKGRKKLKEKHVKTKSIITSVNDKIKKKKKCKDQTFGFVHEVKQTIKEGELGRKIKELSKLQGKKDNRHKIKAEKIEALNSLQSKVQVGSTLAMEEAQISVRKNLEAFENSQIKNSGNRLKECIQVPEIDAVSDVIKTIKLDDENDDCVVSKQTKVSNQKEIDLTVVTHSTQERRSHGSFLSVRSKPIEVLHKNVSGEDRKVNLDISCIDIDQPPNEPDTSTKTIDLDSIVEPADIKTEIIDDNEPCIVTSVVEGVEVGNQVDKLGAGNHFDISKIGHEIEIGADVHDVDGCVPEHLQNDRLDSLLESDITNYPTIPGSESFTTSKDIQNDMHASFSRDICIGDQFLQLPSFFEGNEDVVSRVLGDWPTHPENFGFYREHENGYLPTVLLRSDINFGVLFPEVTIDNEEEEEEISYQAQGQYARGAKVAFGDMATVEENETEWDAQDQEYEEASPANREDSSRSVSEASPVINNGPPMSLQSEPQSFVIDKPLVTEQEHKRPKQVPENQTTYEINGGYDLSKFQQVSVNLKQVAYELPEKPLVKGMLSEEMISLHHKTIWRDHCNFIVQQNFRLFYLSKNVPDTMPHPNPYEMSPYYYRVLRCQCFLCESNLMALIANYNKLCSYIKMISELELRKCQDEELLGKIEESLIDLDPVRIKGAFEAPTVKSDSSLPLKKRKAVLNLIQDTVNSLNCNQIIEDNMHLNSKTAKKIKKHTDLENVCTKNSQTKNNHSECLKEKSNDPVPINIPLMKVVYTSPEGNRLKVKTLTQSQETYSTPPVTDSDGNCDTYTHKSHKHHHRQKRSKEEKRERKERRRLKKLSKL